MNLLYSKPSAKGKTGTVLIIYSGKICLAHGPSSESSPDGISFYLPISIHKDADLLLHGPREFSANNTSVVQPVRQSSNGSESKFKGKTHFHVIHCMLIL